MTGLAMWESLIQARALSNVGRTLRGKWTLEELVGVGGMAAVYRARHRNGACVAIKMLHPIYAEHAEVRQRFVGEGRLANRITHPSVVRVLDDDVDEEPFLVMDFVEGKTLAEAIDHRRFGDDELLDVGEQVCGALVAAHAAGVIHRDLKPDNLLLETNGRVRVLDFGIARLLDEDAGGFATKTGITFGTPGFLVPEQALGHRADIGPKTDLFALGATLFYLATGQFLHECTSSAEQMVFVATRPARKLNMLAPHIDPAVASIVDRATRLELDERWASAADMLSAIREVRRARRTSLAPLRPSLPTRPITLDRTTVRVPVRESLFEIEGRVTRPSFLLRRRAHRSRIAAMSIVAVLLGCVFLPMLLGPTPPGGSAVFPVETASACPAEGSASAPRVEEANITSLPPVLVVASPRASKVKSRELDPLARALRDMVEKTSGK